MRIEVVVLLKHSTDIIKRWRAERDAGDIIAVSETGKVSNQAMWDEVARLGKDVEVFLCLRDDFLDLNLDREFIKQMLNSAKSCNCENNLYLVIDIDTRFETKYRVSIDQWFKTVLRNWATDIIVADFSQERIERELRRSADSSIARMDVFFKLRFERRWFIAPPDNPTLRSFLSSCDSSLDENVENDKNCVFIVDENIAFPLDWLESQKRRYKCRSVLVAVLGNLWLDETVNELETYCRNKSLEIIHCESMFELRYFLLNLTRPRVFVVMPFREETDGVYETIKKASYKYGLMATRADDRLGAGYVLRELYDLIEEANIVICDLTFERPNVYYELGYTHGKIIHQPDNILLIAEDGTKTHFDVNSLRIHSYKKENLLQILDLQLESMTRLL